MKKTILVCGLIAGGMLATLLVVATTICYTKDDFEGSMVVGYAAMLLSFSLTYVGIKNYRDKFNHGAVTFGKAFSIGLYITLIASTIYVLVWVIDYYLFIPDFMDKYCAHATRNLAKEGLPPAELDQKLAQMASMKEMYKNPLIVVLFTYAEVLPVGLVVSIISALILKRKSPEGLVA